MSVYAELHHNGEDVSNAPTKFCFDCRVISTDPQMIFCDRCNGSWEAKSGHYIQAPAGYRFVEKNDEGCLTGDQGEDLFCLITVTKFFA